MTGRLDVLGENAAAYARTALTCVGREYPHLPMIYAVEPGPYRQHRDQHPAFYGSLDWHSAVEMHWVLVRLLRLAGSDLPPALAAEVREGLGAHLTRRTWSARPSSSPPGTAAHVSGRTAGAGCSRWRTSCACGPTLTVPRGRPRYVRRPTC